MKMYASPRKKRSKYNAVKTTVDGITFDSKKEARRYLELKLLLRGGEITSLQRQVRFEFEFNDQVFSTYIADFTYWENGKFIVEDVKGVITSMYRMKKKMMKIWHKIDVRET